MEDMGIDPLEEINQTPVNGILKTLEELSQVPRRETQALIIAVQAMDKAGAHCYLPLLDEALEQIAKLLEGKG